MQRVLVFGADGMLGAYVCSYLEENKYDVARITRNVYDIVKETGILTPTKNDVVINCAGAIKPRVDELGTLNAILVNSAFPRKLARICGVNGTKMLHITTDCVFSGQDGKYNEDAKHDEMDVYGRTKSLGEPENCSVLRTSIIGEEFNRKSRCLLEWVKSSKDKKVNGFTNHHWNGVTCLQLAKVIEEIINKNLWWDGVRHVFSPKDMNKAELVRLISDVYELNITVKEKRDPMVGWTPLRRANTNEYFMDRTLRSKYNLFKIPDVEIQLKDLREYTVKESTGVK